MEKSESANISASAMPHMSPSAQAPRSSLPMSSGRMHVTSSVLSCCCCCCTQAGSSPSSCTTSSILTSTGATGSGCLGSAGLSSTLTTASAGLSWRTIWFSSHAVALCASVSELNDSWCSSHTAVKSARWATTAQCRTGSLWRWRRGGGLQGGVRSATKKRSLNAMILLRTELSLRSLQSAWRRETVERMALKACSSARSELWSRHGGNSCSRLRCDDEWYPSTSPADLAPSSSRLYQCAMRSVASSRTDSERYAKMCECSALGGGTRRCKCW
mmetsp:Transcript_28349/g.67190  ORF Transcript_28349/g.67190 Transcript_28349/m.67190 type:complete len:273 (+) Transcript_28349:260-1078(+)